MTSERTPEPLRTTGQRIWRVTRETALWIGAVLGTLGIVLMGAHATVGITPRIVKSGSMEPAVGVGSMIITREVPATDVEKGDVVTVRDADGDRITHRVVSIESAGDTSRTLTLKGDANATPDASPYTVETVDRLLFTVPYAGYAAAFLRTPGAWLIIGSLLVGAYALSLGDRKAEERSSG